MSVSDLYAELGRLIAAGEGGRRVYVADGSEYTPLLAGAVVLDDESPVVVLDLTVSDEIEV